MVRVDGLVKSGFARFARRRKYQENMPSLQANPQGPIMQASPASWTAQLTTTQEPPKNFAELVVVGANDNRAKPTGSQDSRTFRHDFAHVGLIEVKLFT